MRITVNRRDLQTALSLLARVPNEKSPLPQPSFLRLTVSGQEARLLAHDGHLAMDCPLPVAEAQDGLLTLPFRSLAPLVPGLPDAPIRLEQEEEWLRLSCGQGRYRLPQLKDEFPDFPEIEDGGIQVAEGALRRALRHGEAALSREDSRAFVTSVHLQVKEKALRVTGTDTHRIVVKTVPGCGSPAKESALLGGWCVAALVHALDDEEEPICLQMEEEWIGAIGPRFRFAARRISGVYPEIEPWVSFPATQRLTVDRQALADVVRRLLPLAAGDQFRLLFRHGAGKLFVRIQPGEAGEAEEEMEAESEGFGPFALSGRYLAAALLVPAAERIAFSRGEERVVLRLEGDPPDGSVVAIAPMAGEDGKA
jgi:DNA polymerase-3 subunit beta